MLTREQQLRKRFFDFVFSFTGIIILSLKSGITGPATLKYRNEEELLAQQGNPQEYNDNIIWKEKVRMNKGYIQNWSLLKDASYIIKTFFN